MVFIIITSSFVVQQSVISKIVFNIFFVIFKVHSRVGVAVGDEFINSFREKSDISLGVSKDVFKELLISFSIEEFFQVFSVDFDDFALVIRNFLL